MRSSGCSESFDQSKEYRLSLKVDSLDVQRGSGRREGAPGGQAWSHKGGQSFRNESSFTFRLKRAGLRWVIEAVN